MSNLTKAVILNVLKEDGVKNKFTPAFEALYSQAGHPWGHEFTQLVVRALRSVSPTLNTMLGTGTWKVTSGTANAIVAKLEVR